MTYLSMYRGDDRELTITASEDLTGCDVRFTAKARPSSAMAVLEKSTDPGGGITIDTTTVTVAIEAADTVDLDPVALHWDVEIVDLADKVHTVAHGRLAILQDITRPAGS